MRLGVPYKGSKNSIAEDIISRLPDAEWFCDLFAGGCALTHAAVLSGKYKKFLLNDIDGDGVRLFITAIKGTYKNDTRWISREDFFRLKDSDPYVRYVWSFGNDGRTYCYGKDTERRKRAFHNALFFGDYSESDEMGLRLRKADGLSGRDRYREMQRIVREKIPNDRGLESYERMQNLKPLEVLEKRLCDMTVLFKSYDDVDIPENSVLICDIPYKNTNSYDRKKLKSDCFDHEGFYGWCGRQEKPLFVCEYDMPDDRFTRISAASKLVTMSASNNGIRKEDGLYVPVHQYKTYKKEQYTQGLLFGETA